MWIRLSGIPPQGVAVSSPVPLGQLALAQEDWSADGPIRVDMVVTRDRELIMVDGTVAAVLRFRCSRCLETCSRPLQAAVHLALAPAGSEPPESRHQLNATDLEQLFYQDGGLETDDVVREQLLLSIPMQVVCRPECRGLCPACGRNLNEGPCGCPAPPSTPWVEQLKRFRS
jgi:uncharacterized protein